MLMCGIHARGILRGDQDRGVEVLQLEQSKSQLNIISCC